MFCRKASDQKENIIPEENNNEDTPGKLSNKQIAKNIFKGTNLILYSNIIITLDIDLGTLNSNPNENPNLASNYKEKSTPIKENIDERLVKSERKNSPHFLKKFSTEQAPLTDPPKRQRYYIIIIYFRTTRII